MERKAVVTEIREGIGKITLNRPESMNTFSSALARDLSDALEAMESNPEVVVIVLGGAGKHFSTGIDLKEFLSKEKHEIREFLRLMDRHNNVLFAMSKPVIASVQGYTLANGAGLALACDFIVAAENAVFGTTAINVGLICLEPGYQLSRWIGPKRALQYVLTGDFIPAEEALRLGIASQVVPLEKLEEATMEFAAKLAKKSPLALKTGKRGLQQMEGLTLERAIEAAGERFAALAATEDAREGLEAFLGKREPVWRGR
ncbi:MAG: enoyl-CoA hydratase/isomerase family protein [Dethiosulfovibrio sp.]|nr:enoyl-CoA hydratase/isomerase family protein [Dethiosulfovibrio sp.]